MGIGTMGVSELLNDLAARGVDLWVESGKLKFRSRQGGLTPELREAVSAQKQVLIDHFGDGGCTTRLAPLSYNQQALYFLNRTAPASPAYNVGFALRIRSEVKPEALRQALQALIDRHEALRTTYVAGDEPRQKIFGRQPAAFSVVDAPGHDEAALRAIVLAAHRRPFDLERGPIVRTTLFTQSNREHVLLFTFHHIAGDGQSVWTILNELQALYRAYAAGGRADLPPVAVLYTDFVERQRRLLDGPRGVALRQFWQRQMEHRPEPLALPWERNPQRDADEGSTVSFELRDPLVERLRAVARSQGTTLFTVLMAAWQVLLTRYAGQQSVLVAMPVLGRSGAEFHTVVGDFMNTVVVQGTVRSDMTFGELLASIRQQVLDAIEHQDYPFSLLVQRLGIRYEPGQTPLFQTMFQWHQPGSHELSQLLVPAPGAKTVDFGGLAVEPYVFPQQETITDISLEIVEFGRSLLGQMKHRLDRLSRRTVERMQSDFETLLHGVAASPDMRLVDLPRQNLAEQRRLVVDWNATDAEYPKDVGIHALIEAVAAATPDRPALEQSGRTLSYGELNARANRLAHRLRALGVGPGVLVGIGLNRSFDMVTALVAVLKSGGAYIPLDPDFPRQRLAWMLEDAAPPLLLTQRELLDHWPDTPGLKHLCLDRPAERLDGEPDTNLPDIGNGESLAYTIFTSGSTGRPKGIQIPRRAVMNMLTGLQRQLQVGADDRLLAVTTLSFDIAVLELLLPLTSGAIVRLATRDEAADPTSLASLLSDVTVMQATPATWRLLCDSGWSGARALKVLCGGEALPPDLAASLLSRCGELWNMYGPTETTVWSSAERVESADTVTIGRPIANTRIYVLDGDLRPTPIGVAGDLWIGGDGVAVGYLGQPELTAERFIANPFRPGERMYRSGDLARWRDDGRLEHLGRVDHQVKIRGFRIELQEIEQALMRIEGITAAVVVAHDPGVGDRRLVAYCVTPAATTPEAASTIRITLRNALADVLPDYAMPAWFEMVDRLPMTPNGKIDRQALPAPTFEPVAAAPRGDETKSPVEDTVARIWADVLGVKYVGLHDDFFELGGHSLLAATLVRQLNDIFWVELPLRTLFDAPTVASMSEVLVRRVHERRPTNADQRSGVLGINIDGANPPFFFFHAALEGEGFYCYNLARHLGTDQPFYGVEPLGLDGREIPPTIEAIARRQVDEIRRIQPHGPYYLGGFCVSGGVALEAAQQLRAMGERVEMLIVIESYLAAPDRLGALARQIARMGRRLLFLRPRHELALAVVLRWYGSRLGHAWAGGPRAVVAAAGRELRRRSRQLLHRVKATAAGWLRRGPAVTRPLYETAQGAYGYAIYAYSPQRYDSPMVCVMAEQTELSAGVWKGVAASIEVRVVPGDHNTCITTKVGPLAEVMRHALRRAQTGAGIVATAAAATTATENPRLDSAPPAPMAGQLAGVS